ncbi:MAG: response regulator transcription factor [Anaerolineales bacterium]
MTTETHILVIDDEPQIQRALRTILTARQFKVSLASNGEEGLALAATAEPDLIILDLGLPDMDGLEVCRQIREWSKVPIIVLSVRESERDKVMALDWGADDYLTKPFAIEELLARIRVALRHASSDTQIKPAILHSGNLVVDLRNHLVLRDGEEIKLTAKEFKLLAYLAANAGKVLTHRAILAQVWDPADIDHLEYLRVYIRQLRKKIEEDPDNPQIIVNEPGIGYRFIAKE